MNCPTRTGKRFTEEVVRLKGPVVEYKTVEILSSSPGEQGESGIITTKGSHTEQKSCLMCVILWWWV